MSRREIIYSAQNVADFFQGTFDIPLDGVESDIEGFEDDISDVAESLDSIPMEEDEEDLRRFPDEISEDEDSDSSKDCDSGEEERESVAVLHVLHLKTLHGVNRGVRSIFLNFEKKLVLQKFSQLKLPQKIFSPCWWMTGC